MSGTFELNRMTWTEIKKKIDNMWIGSTLGAVLPMIGFFVSKLVKDRSGTYSFKAYFNLLVGENDHYLDILGFSLLPSMLLFYFLFFQWKLDKAVKGMVFITFMIVGLFMVLH